MNTGGEAAEQIVRMSLEGFEVAAKITGAGAKNIAILLYSILKEEKKTKGKARLTSMLRSGKGLPAVQKKKKQTAAKASRGRNPSRLPRRTLSRQRIKWRTSSKKGRSKPPRRKKHRLLQNGTAHSPITGR